MKLRKTALIGGLTALLLSQTGLSADVLGPKDSSQIVDVLANIGSDSCAGGGGFTFDHLLRPDGTTVPFAIPEGKRLVITGVEILGFSFTPGDTAQTRIFRHFGLQGIPNHLIAMRESVANAQGRIFHIYEFNPGVVVASNVSVCVDSNLLVPKPPIAAILRGYLTDK